MSRRLKDEIAQQKPFASIEEEVYLELQRTAQVTNRWVLEALKPHGITPVHLNVLRILRGATEALPAGVIHERMVNRDPDVTRLVDRLVAAGLVEKERDTVDRRVVLVSITKQGLAVTKAATAAAERALVERLSRVGTKKLEQLADVLDAVRRLGDSNGKESRS